MAHTHDHTHHDSRKAAIIADLASDTAFGQVRWEWSPDQDGSVHGRDRVTGRRYAYFMYDSLLAETHMPAPLQLRQSDGAGREHERLRSAIIAQVGPAPFGPNDPAILESTEHAALA